MRKTRLVGSALLISSLCVTAGEAQTVKRKSRPNNRVSTAASAMSRPHLGSEAYASSLAKARQEWERYKGITVKPDVEAVGEDLAVQKRVGEILTKLDYVPPERLHRFRWIPEEMRTPITGWSARILSATPSPDGLVVKMKVYPRHDGDGGFYAPNDYLIETYVVRGGRVDYRQSEGPPSRGIVIYN